MIFLWKSNILFSLSTCFLAHDKNDKEKILGLNMTCGDHEHNCGCPEISSQIDEFGNPIKPGCLCVSKSVMCDGIVDCYPIQFYSDEGPEMCGNF